MAIGLERRAIGVMSIRLRKWKGPNGEIKQAWIANYTGPDNKRHIKTFAHKRHARAFHTKIENRLRFDDGMWRENVLTRLDDVVKLLHRLINERVR
jgi:hypothetical protein